MSPATLCVRVGVTAAAAIVSIGLAAAPAFASTNPSPASGIGPVNGQTLGPANPSPFGPANPPPTTQLSVQPARPSKQTASRVVLHNDLVRKVLHEARRQKGKPYIYGDAGPHGFDCSGLVRFVFMHSVHRVLPHNAAQQYHALRHIRRSSLAPGDLVFVDNGGYISHVGIYDGHGYWWVAPHTGTHVQRQKIYHAHFLYARVLVYNKHPKK